MQISIMRKGSQGIKGTYANIAHHAQRVLPIVRILEEGISKLKHVKEWQQGHNVHVLHAEDGRRLVFRPFRRSNEDSVHAIEVLVKISRTDEYSIATICSERDAVMFLEFLPMFFDTYTNCYGISDGEKEEEA